MVRHRKLKRFIETVTVLPELYTEFDPAQWSALVDCVTVMDKKRMVWTLTSGMEVES